MDEDILSMLHEGERRLYHSCQYLEKVTVVIKVRL